MNDMYIPDNALKYILFQRTDLLCITKLPFIKKIIKVLPPSYFNQIISFESTVNKKGIKKKYKEEIQKEYNIIKDYLPGNCKTVLDIGCGIAGIDVFINKHFLSSNLQFFLLDKTQREESMYYDYNKRAAFYNSLFVAKNVLINNNINEENIHLIEATSDNDIDINQNADLIISLISWGFHYPVDTYLEKADKILNVKGRIILDIRKETNGLRTMNSKFQDIRIIYNARKYHRIVAIK